MRLQPITTLSGDLSSSINYYLLGLFSRLFGIIQLKITLSTMLQASVQPTTQKNHNRFQNHTESWVLACFLHSTAWLSCVNPILYRASRYWYRVQIFCTRPNPPAAFLVKVFHSFSIWRLYGMIDGHKVVGNKLEILIT